MPNARIRSISVACNPNTGYFDGRKCQASSSQAGANCQTRSSQSSCFFSKRGLDRLEVWKDVQSKRIVQIGCASADFGPEKILLVPCEHFHAQLSHYEHFEIPLSKEHVIAPSISWICDKKTGDLMNIKVRRHKRTEQTEWPRVLAYKAALDHQYLTEQVRKSRAWLKVAIPLSALLLLLYYFCGDF